MELLKKVLLRLRNIFTKKDDSVIPTDFSDLAPLDSIDNTSEYLNALDWALKNRRIRNVALCGPYGAGKSSMKICVSVIWNLAVVIGCRNRLIQFAKFGISSLGIKSLSQHGKIFLFTRMHLTLRLS